MLNDLRCYKCGKVIPISAAFIEIDGWKLAICPLCYETTDVLTPQNAVEAAQHTLAGDLTFEGILLKLVN